MNTQKTVLIFILILAFGVKIPLLQADEIPVQAPAEAAAEETQADAAEPALDASAAPAEETAPAPAIEEAPVAPEEAPAQEVAAEEPAAETAPEEAATEEAAAAPAEETKAEESKESLLAQFPPQVKLSQWGPEIRINVIPNAEMGADKILEIQSVKLETEKGEYLGLKTFQAEEKSREAEFMINPEILKVDAVKLTVSGKSGDLWTKIQPLKDEAGEGPEAGTPDAVKPAETPAPAPKKKGWLW